MDDFRIFLEFEKEVTCNLIMTDRSLFHERTYETIQSGRRLILLRTSAALTDEKGKKMIKIASDLEILVCFCFLVICSIFVPSNSSADDKLPLEFQAITGFPGSGIHVGYHYNDLLFLGAQTMNLKFKHE